MQVNAYIHIKLYNFTRCLVTLFFQQREQILTYIDIVTGKNIIHSIKK